MIRGQLVEIFSSNSTFVQHTGCCCYRFRNCFVIIPEPLPPPLSIPRSIDLSIYRIRTSSFTKDKTSCHTLNWFIFTYDKRRPIFREVEKRHHHSSSSSSFYRLQNGEKKIIIIIFPSNPICFTKKQWCKHSKKKIY